MSVEYTLFLRDKPQLEADALGAMALEVRAYVPRPGDPIEREAWRSEIRWVIEASGRISDDDEWTAFVQRICARCRGVVWEAATGELDEPDDIDDDDAYEARLDADYDKLKAMIERAASEPATMQALKRKDTTESPAFQIHFTDLLVRWAAKGAERKPWGWALRFLKLDRRTHGFETSASRARLAKKGTLAAAMVERFEARLARGAERTQRAEASALDKRRAQFEHWLKQADRDPPLIEKRRRAGELLAGIPRSTGAHIARGELEAAIADYAQRYELKPDVARKVVSHHAAELAKQGSVAPIGDARRSRE